MPAFSFSSEGIKPGYGVGGGLPVGKHPVVVNSVSLEGTTAGTGGKMVIALEIIDGPAKGVKGNEQLTLQHTNPVTVRIAEEQLTSICVVAGLRRPDGHWGITNTTEELHGKTFVVEVAPQKKDTQYTEVVNVFTMDGLTAKEVVANGGAANQGGGNGSFGNNANNGNNNQGGGQQNNGGNQGGGWGGGAANNQGGGQTENNANNQGGGNTGGGNTGGGWQQGGGNTGGDAGNNGGGNPGWGAR